MGRHSVRAATPSEDDSSGDRAWPPIGEIVPRLRAAVREWLGEAPLERPKVVLTGAAAVVSLLALCGVVVLARGFVPTAEACAQPCEAERPTGTEPTGTRPADPRPSTPAATPTRHTSGSTLQPAVVRQEKRARPRATVPDNGPMMPPQIPGPQWRRPAPPWRGHGPGG